MKVKTNDLIGPALDWAVAKCENTPVHLYLSLPNYPLLVLPGEENQVDDFYTGYSPSTDWAQGGPIIAREFIELHTYSANDDGVVTWRANDYMDGPTTLIAAMRCFVASKLGDEVEVPEELTRAASR